MKLNLAIFLSSNVAVLSAVVIVLAIVTKFIGCGLGAVGMGWKRAIQVGVGMIPRGEVGIVVAQIGVAMAAIGEQVYGVVLAMAVVTTLVAPPFIKLAFAGEQASIQPDGYDAERQDEMR
jgi:Kef-type K+ transport system membrane component KefB